VTLTKAQPILAHTLAVVFFLVSVFFVWRSFYGMRIDTKTND
jgi:K(+)-stimulated pyrophosphate-energized sodium pump